ncbi:hypothetical protein HPP92_008379 [Vanilla planifolia]|uniref:BHLH domain-containing protein n=1 Tax=Vanilla planifolia TaxID=51239 RepID=A0A835RC96_VANPL|nr:hypothetical protein HPP92_008379 [Vanilla planifolia]
MRLPEKARQQLGADKLFFLPLDTLERQLKTYTGGHMIESERVTSNLTDLISHWTIAPPNPHIEQVHITPSTCNVSMSPNPMPYLSPHIKHELGEGSTFSLGGLTNGDQVMSDAPWAAARTTPDLNSYVSQHKPSSLRSQRWFESSKRGGQYETSSFTKGSGRGSGTAYEGKKKRTEDSSEAVLKKFKHESPSASPANKMQAPKVKVSEKITALQQIVSPFGRTDTASVLLEAINYISYLQEQIQLLSDPYLKSSSNKDHNSWHGLERKEKTENKSDLRSRGLCLVPISCTPQIYRENTGPDYWTPPYRGCLLGLALDWALGALGWRGRLWTGADRRWTNCAGLRIGKIRICLNLL